MSRRYFGTDGVRGRVGEPPITADFVLKLGWAAGQALRQNGRERVLIGKDTRVSGYMFESALEAGLSAAGVDVLLTGPMPTPAIAYLTRTLHCSAGIVISASHNPFDDNGIKFFSARGTKLPDAVEEEIEAWLERPMTTERSDRLGKASRVQDAAGRYIEFCKATVPSTFSLKGLRIVVDCAHGATYHIAPAVFDELGAEVTAIGVDPDGFNINDGVGATVPAALQRAVVEQGADLGIAFDGDGDRVIMVDERGEVVDGDAILYVIALSRRQSGHAVRAVVGTLMTNLGLEHALARQDIRLHRARVGDRYVLETMEREGCLLGGESSGHIICLDRTTTGDGIVAALQVLFELVRREVPLSELVRDLEPYPQQMINVRVAERTDPMQHPRIAEAVAAAERELDGQGRVLLRASGTEPVIRVMVEGRDESRVAHLVQRLADEVAAALAG
ncbi:MAG: phosphoglucosamine mutase [Gammaproteobacteria bacterium]|nr:MAG: phosphoglucosamine mutase [Gammaproteobacteria bacterium]